MLLSFLLDYMLLNKSLVVFLEMAGKRDFPAVCVDFGDQIDIHDPIIHIIDFSEICRDHMTFPSCISLLSFIFNLIDLFE